MPKRKLTAAAVEKLGPPESGRIEYFDTLLRGFALRITARGSKSWVLFYRVHGRQRRMTIGSYPMFDLSEAREEARKALQLVEKGQDPAAIREEQRRKRPDTVIAVAENFIQRHAKPNNRTWREVERMFEIHVLPTWGKRDIGSITRRDVIDLLDQVADRTSSVRANRVLANVRKLFAWAAERDIIESSPVAGVKPPGRENERDRVLTDNEIKAFWKATEVLGWPFGPFAQMLLVTAQRRDEVAHMRWDDIDEHGVWTIPKEKTKANRSHEVPLPSLALEILERTPRIGSYVFMSGRAGARPISGFGKAKAKLERLSGIHNWRYHDLRRTAGTNMARHGVPISTISRVLNHAEGGVTRIYARYSYLNEKRKALNTWARTLAGIIRPTESNVIPLESRQER